MDIFQKALNWANSLIFGQDQNVAIPTDQTVAPHNIHTISFDITIKPKFEDPTQNIIPVDNDPSLDLKPILNDLLNSFIGNDNTDVTKSTTIMNISEDDGNSFVKVVEDATGKSVEVWHDILAEITTTANEISNSTKSNVTKIDSESENTVNCINDYIIATLVLILVMMVCIGILVWCRSNRLKAEKRNKYPVMTVVNNEYMNPQNLKNNEKLKNIP